MKLFNLLWIIIPSICLGQSIDQNFFRSPVDHQIKLSGSFAELRSSHFHMGIDIKSSKGISGDPIICAADGYLSRIKVDASGYGQALYINHSNGYTTVYAHLDTFNDSIGKYVKNLQLTNESFELDVTADSLKWFISKGQQIATMGNKGNSFGPHLHFEVRETSSEISINPFLFGIMPSDKRSPVMQSLIVSSFNEKGDEISNNIYKIKAIRNGYFQIEDDTIEVEGSHYTFAIQMYDQMDGTYNKNGVYEMEVLKNNKLVHGYKMDKVSYEETGYINLFVDYKEKSISKRQFTNCFTYPMDSLQVYTHNRDSSSLNNFVLDKMDNIKVILSDFHGNNSQIAFTVRQAKVTNSAYVKTESHQIVWNKKNTVPIKDGFILFKENTFRDNTDLIINQDFEITNGDTSVSIKIGGNTIPIFRPFDLYIKVDSNHVKQVEKLCLLQCIKEKATAYNGILMDGYFKVSVPSLGEYRLSLDTIAPTIELKSFKLGQKIELTINDNYESANKNQRLAYRATIDGNWILVEYDLKNDLLIHFLDNNLPKGEHLFNLSVSDSRGNRSHFSRKFNL